MAVILSGLKKSGWIHWDNFEKSQTIFSCSIFVSVLDDQVCLIHSNSFRSCVYDDLEELSQAWLSSWEIQF